MTDYSMANRTYRYSLESPLYPFGYGLSYTQFKYIDLTLTPETIGPCDDVSVNVTLMNIGKYDADEVRKLSPSLSHVSLFIVVSR